MTAQTKEYRADYYAKNKQRILDRQALYREQNKERIRERDRQYRIANVGASAQYYKDNKQKLVEYNARYREDKKDILKTKAVEYRRANLSELKERDAQYYQNNREIAADRASRYYASNCERVKRVVLQYRKANPHKVAVFASNKKLALSRATPSWSETDQIDVVYKKRDEYRQLYSILFEVDHIIPIVSDTVCGLHVLANLQLLDKSLNCTKTNNYQADW